MEYCVINYSEKVDILTGLENIGDINYIQKEGPQVLYRI